MFQYFPETITDTKAINYQTREIPGGSLPLYQWISSGERVISFTALFTTDVDLLVDPSSFLKIKQNGQLRRNVDVRTALLWLRRFLLPRYDDDGGLGVPLTSAPRKMILRIPNSGFGLTGGTYGAEAYQGEGAFSNPIVHDPVVEGDAIPCIMTQCDITYEAFFPSGLPRIASVQLQLAQIAQLAGTVNFPRGSDQLDKIVTDGQGFSKGNVTDLRKAYFPYSMKVKFQ